MKIIGRFNGISIDYKTGETIVSFSTSQRPQVIEEECIKFKDNPLEINADIKRNRRSNDANRLLWECLKELSIKRKEDNWELYLEMLRKYGVYTYACIRPNAVESFKKRWREVQEVGTVNINGEEATQLLCFYGSSTYDSKEFSRLLDGVIEEMARENLPTPTSKEMRLAIERIERNEKCSPN